MITTAHLGARVSRRAKPPAAPAPALTPEPPDAGPLRSDRRPGSPLDQSPQTQRSAASARSRVPLRRKRPAGTRGSGDIDKPSAVTGRACSIGDRAASEIDAPGPRLTPTCGGRTRRPRTEEGPLPDDHPRSQSQLGALDPRSPITEEGLMTGPLPPPRRAVGTFSFKARAAFGTPQNAGICGLTSGRPISGRFSDATEPRHFGTDVGISIIQWVGGCPKGCGFEKLPLNRSEQGS